MRGVLGTSVFIAGEQGRDLNRDRLPDHAAISVVTLAELERRIGRSPKVQDTWIAATARAHAVAVYTQDGDLEDLDVEVVRV